MQNVKNNEIRYIYIYIIHSHGRVAFKDSIQLLVSVSGLGFRTVIDKSRGSALIKQKNIEEIKHTPFPQSIVQL